MTNVSPDPERRSGHRNGSHEDEPEVSSVTPAEDMRTVVINRVEWGAVFAGVAVALVSQVLLNMVGLGIGAGAVDPTTSGDNPDASSVSIGAGIWWAVSGIIAAFLGGLAAGRLSGKPDQSTAAWHGLCSWAVTTLALLWLVTTAVSSIVGGSLQMLGNIGGQAAQGATQAAGANLGRIDPLSMIESRVRGNTGDRQAQISDAVSEIRALMLASPQQADAQRDRAAQALARVQNVPVDQARTQIAEYEKQYRDFVGQAQRTATSAAGTASRTISWTAIMGAIALALGALAAWFGGRVGAVDPTITPMARLREAVPPRFQGRLQ